MTLPVQVTFRNLSHSDALEAEIRKRAAALERFCEGIVACRVLIDLPHRHHQDGRRFHVRIELSVPGEDVIVSREGSLHGFLKDLGEEQCRKSTEIESVHSHVRVAVHEAFDAARRRLQDHARRQRGAIKTHKTPAHGIVSDLRPGDGYGFIESTDSRKVYFHRASVLDEAFDRLTVGSEVTFTEEQGERGPQASTVRALGKHHYVED